MDHDCVVYPHLGSRTKKEKTFHQTLFFFFSSLLYVKKKKSPLSIRKKKERKARAIF